LALANISHKKKQEKQLVSVYINLTSREKIDLLTNLKLAQFIQVSGKVDLEMVLESRHGQMERSISENGVKIEPMEKENLFMLTEMFMMVFGQTTKQTDPEFISMLMERCMRVNGKTTYNMVRVLKPGRTKVDTKVNMLLDESMVLEAINGTMGANIRVTGAKIK
jgi:hypothetical protein